MRELRAGFPDTFADVDQKPWKRLQSIMTKRYERALGRAFHGRPLDEA